MIEKSCLTSSRSRYDRYSRTASWKDFETESSIPFVKNSWSGTTKRWNWKFYDRSNKEEVQKRVVFKALICSC